MNHHTPCLGEQSVHGRRHVCGQRALGGAQQSAHATQRRLCECVSVGQMAVDKKAAKNSEFREKSHTKLWLIFIAEKMNFWLLQSWVLFLIIINAI